MPDSNGRALARISGLPAVRALHVNQPVEVDAHMVTFWGAVSDEEDRYASVTGVAEILLQLHRLTPPDDLHLPELAPFANAPKRIDSSIWLTADDRTFLTTMLADMQAAYAELGSSCHPASSTVTPTSAPSCATAAAIPSSSI